MSFENLEVQVFKEQIEQNSNAVILDVRTPAEIEEISIPNHITIDFNGGGFQEEAQKLDKTKDYYVYCRSGGRSAKACEILSQLGVSKAYNLVGGITAWEMAGYND